MNVFALTYQCNIFCETDLEKGHIEDSDCKWCAIHAAISLLGDFHVASKNICYFKALIDTGFVFDFKFPFFFLKHQVTEFIQCDFFIFLAAFRFIDADINIDILGFYKIQ